MQPQRTTSWPDLPSSVRAGVEELLRGPVLSWAPQHGGFSPGSADRVVLADGRRAFVKAATVHVNPDSPGIHRREAGVLASLPPDVPAPALIGCVDDGDTVALVIEDVEGRRLGGPWADDDLDAALAALDELADRATPCPVPGLPDAGPDVAEEMAGWRRLHEDPDPALDHWAARHLERLVDVADAAVPALAGDTLVHTDVRGDNLLRTADGRVVLVDWPWACRGVAWFDPLTLLLNGLVDGGHDPEERVAASTSLASADPDDVTAVLTGLAGFFVDASRRPAPPGLPTLRAFQRAQGHAALRWLRQRTGWS